MLCQAQRDIVSLPGQAAGSGALDRLQKH